MNLQVFKYSTALFALVVLSSCYGRKPKTLTGLEGKPMPSIELLGVDSSTHFNTASITAGKPTLLFSFETWCPYCKAQTESMLSKIDKLKDVNIYMACQTQFPEFKKFYEKYHLSKYPNIHAGIDVNHSMVQYFKSPAIPYLAIYSNDKKLNRVFIGKTPISTIKETALE